MKTVKNYAAQGDMMLIRYSGDLPKGFEPAKDRIVAHSETGHHHIAQGDCVLYKSDKDPMRMFLVARDSVSIEHKRDTDTHETLDLFFDTAKGAKNIWEIRRQREHTPEGWRRVED
jgi:hypothetical protein